MNKKLIKQLRAIVVANKRWNQEHWYTDVAGIGYRPTNPREDVLNHCGTCCCVAGWACVLTNAQIDKKLDYPHQVTYAFAKAIGVDDYYLIRYIVNAERIQEELIHVFDLMLEGMDIETIKDKLL